MNAENRALVERILALLEARHPQTQPELLDALAIERESREDKRVRQVILRAIQRKLIPVEWVILNSVRGHRKPQTVALMDWLEEILTASHPKTKRWVFYQVIGDQARLADIYEGKDVPAPRSIYNMVCDYINELCLSRRIPWPWIIDESRRYEGVSTFSSLDEYLDAVKRRTDEDEPLLDPWEDQPQRVECWIEKATLNSVLAPVLDHYRVQYLPAHGNLPWVWAQKIAQRIVNERKRLVVLYLGDYDPTGLNIPKHIAEVVMPRLLIDLGESMPDDWFELRRVAATEEDRERFLESLVPVKSNEWAQRQGKRQGDPNARAYLERHGEFGLEVDALPAEELQERLESTILDLIDQDAWERTMEREARAKEIITEMVKWTRRRLRQSTDGGRPR